MLNFKGHNSVVHCIQNESFKGDNPVVHCIWMNHPYEIQVMEDINEESQNKKTSQISCIL